MKKIVIVEDRIKRAASLAKQFELLAEQWNIKDIVICFFRERPSETEEDIRKAKDSCKHEIKDVYILDFNKVMDAYMNEEETYFIIDYQLNGDGSEGDPIRRINIRYARNKDRYKTNRLWFYTATGPDNERILGKLFGKEHMLYVSEVDEDLLTLELNNSYFSRAMENKHMVCAEG